jgi:hypothetical protein
MDVLFIAVGIVILFCSAFIQYEKDYTNSYMTRISLIILGLVFFAGEIYNIAHRNGIEDGAYNLLRGKYEIAYVFEDSCVVDTVIILDK